MNREPDMKVHPSSLTPLSPRVTVILRIRLRRGDTRREGRGWVVTRKGEQPK